MSLDKEIAFLADEFLMKVKRWCNLVGLFGLLVGFVGIALQHLMVATWGIASVSTALLIRVQVLSYESRRASLYAKDFRKGSFLRPDLEENDNCSSSDTKCNLFKYRCGY